MFLFFTGARPDMEMKQPIKVHPLSTILGFLLVIVVQIVVVVDWYVCNTGIRTMVSFPITLETPTSWGYEVRSAV